MKYVVSVSGGLTSFEAWRRCLEKHGPENTIPIFADVGTVVENGVIVSGEDEDLYRFLDETEAFLGQKIIRLRSEKYTDIWDVFFKVRFIGNSKLDPCSQHLKRELIARWIRENTPDATVVVGFNASEFDRAFEYRSYVPNSWFPLLEEPHVTIEQIGDWLEARGIRRPRLYTQGFTHNNCGGFCVKMGVGQLYDLWKLRPERYEYNERMEAKFRAEISAKASVFPDRRGKKKTPMSMAQFRERFEQGYVPRTAGEKGCGGRCMIPQQMDLL